MLQGTWLEVGGAPYLLVLEEGTATLPAYLKVFKYDHHEDQMVTVCCHASGVFRV